LAENIHPVGHAWWTYDAALKIHRDTNGFYRPEHFARSVRTIDPIVDVWHVHNEPDWPVGVIRKCSKKPIVFDIHDLESKRGEGPDKDETEAFDVADGYSVVSRKYQEICMKLHMRKPSREVLSCVPYGLFPKKRAKVYRGGIVYEGGLGGEEAAQFGCRDWAETFTNIVEEGTQVWAYSSNPSVSLNDYKNVIILPSLPYNALLQHMTSYEFGLVGSPEKSAMFDGALPNKMFDYMAAGLPMICMNAPDVSNFLSATGMGVTVGDVKEIPDAMKYMRDRKYRKRVWESRLHWTMEGQVGKVTWLYEQVTGKKLQKPIVPGEFGK
jgi:glycosyltransferase involved in cell wall biosynthesis